MSILKNILSPFIEFPEDKKIVTSAPNVPAKPENEAKAEPSKNTAPAAAQNVPPPVTNDYTIPVPSPLATSATPGAPVTALPEHQTYFGHLIEEANAKNPLFEGTDFKEFVDSKSDIEAITDEPTRYRTAFSVLKRTGLTKERLLSTGQEYMNLIGRALNSYQSAFAQQYQKEVKEKENLLQKKAEEVQALNEKMAALKADIKKISEEININKSKLDANKSSFLAAGETKQVEIQNELQKINQYF